MSLTLFPARVLSGAYVFHSGLDKWKADEGTGEALQGMAAGTYPFLAKLPPRRFLQLLAVGEMGVGAAVALPFVPPAIAGAALTAFSGALMGLYARTPGMRREGSIWPTQDGIGLAKDVWLVGIGLSLLVDAARNRGDDSASWAQLAALEAAHLAGLAEVADVDVSLQAKVSPSD